MKIELTFTEELLATCPGDKEVYQTFIQKKNERVNDVDEAAFLPEDQLEKGTTVFMREEGKPFIFNYLMTGFFKDACGALRRVSTTKSAALKAFKKEIDGLIFIAPRKLMIGVPDGEKIGICERPLRAQTAQGERVTLARSETCPIGSKIILEINMLKKEHEAVIREWLDYGALKGLGQWRNSGKGRFTWREIE